MYGVILAGGQGTRLYPLSRASNKQLLSVYDKPLIYYPLSMLMLAGVKKFIFIINKEDKKSYLKLFNNGSKLGIKINYCIQNKPEGIPQALTLSKKYIKNKNEKIFLILGDNIFYGNHLASYVKNGLEKNIGCSIFLYKVKNPEDYGIAKIKNKKITSIFEKPKKYIGSYAITGVYIFDYKSINLANKLKKSKRGEFEIVDLIKIYQSQNLLNYEIFERGIFWVDCGTPQNLFKSSELIHVIESRTKSKIGCVEEIAYEKKFISRIKFKKLISDMPTCEYKEYLSQIV